MNNVRLFVIINFANEDVLPDFFELMNSYFGKYDYFTQNIKISFLPGGSSGFNKLRVFSFKKYINPLKMKSILRKVETISTRLVLFRHHNFNILSGYINSEQVISFHNKYEARYILVDKNSYACLQLNRSKNNWAEFEQTSNEFRNSEVKMFFNDLSRIYKGNL